MTVQEAIKTCFGKPYVVDVDKHEEAIKTIKEALKELEQYRALGTVEEIKKKIQTELPYMSIAQSRFKSELDEYRNIGTVEELKEAREKQVAKKPIEKEFHKMLHWNCPICEGGLFHEQQYCDECGTKIDWGECGQKLDWSEEDEPMSNSSPRL